jgi:starch synthase
MAVPLKICFAAAEAAPFAKTGGLADVAAALPGELHRRGHDVRVFVPFHSVIDRSRHALQPLPSLGDLTLQLGGRTYTFSVWSAALAGGDRQVCLLDCPELYHRTGVYTSGTDEPIRFAAFSRAVIECCQRMGFAPDVFHCNDWHTSLIPLLLRTVYEWDSLFRHSATLLTIHNLGYQGTFPREVLGLLGLGEFAYLFDQEDLHTGRVNFLRTGLIYADVVSTVSPSYAAEIQTPEFGMGLDPLLRARRDSLFGILNGVDYDEWSPEKDLAIPFRFSAERLEGKAKNKLYLLDRLGLDPTPAAPLLGVVSRLAHHKGFDLCFDVLPEALAATDLRCVVVGSGEPTYEGFFAALQQRFPRKACFHRGYNNELAHVIEAGSDMLLMPSRYEPCGLNQLFGLRYGTIPIVRKTGGLADSVRPVGEAVDSATGIVFEHFTPDALRWALGRAIELYRDGPSWRRLMANAMRQDFSWRRQARHYLELYQRMSGRR